MKDPEQEPEDPEQEPEDPEQEPKKVQKILVLIHKERRAACILGRDEAWLAKTAPDGVLSVEGAQVSQSEEIAWDPDKTVSDDFLVNFWLSDYASDGEDSFAPEHAFTLVREGDHFVDAAGGPEGEPEMTHLHRRSYGGDGVRLPVVFSPRIREALDYLFSGDD